EITPDLFELRVVSSRSARGGSTLRARVRTANPVGNRPVKGVAVGAQLVFDIGIRATVLKASAMTDGDGLASLDFRLPRFVEDDADAELKVTARRGIITQKADAEVSVEQQPRILLTTDKSLYQPGQMLHMRALVFDPSDHAVAGEEVGFTLKDEDDATVFKQTLKTSRYGIASADWPIPENARLGSYKITLAMDDEKYDEDYESSIYVKVSRYDLPNFKVEVKPDRPFYLAGQNAETEVRGDYLFGQPVKRGHVRVVRQTERRWNYKEQKYETEEQDPVEGDLDERGRFVARLDLAKEHKELAESGYQRFLDLDFAAYVTDPTTNRTEQRRFSVRLTKDPIHLYVNEGRYKQARGLPLAFYVSTFYADGAPAECEVSVVEEGATTIVSAPGEPRREVKDRDRTILKVRTNRYGVAKATGPPVSRGEESGNVSLRFTARDREGRAGHHEDDFWLIDEDDKSRAEIRVETDKTLYRAGEPVAVELTSNKPRTSVIVDASSDGRVLFSKVVRLGGGRASLVIPYSAEMRGAVRVTATSAEAPTDDYEDYLSSGTRTVVYPRNRELNLDVRLSQKSFRPGEDAGVEFALRSPEGRRAEGALGVVVFDTAVEERARTEDEFSRNFGFAGSLYGFLYGTGVIAGISQREIEQLDLSRPVPVGLEEVAEMLFNGERPYNEQNFSSGTEFERDQAQVFASLVGAQLQPLKDAVNNRYALRAEYPADEAALVKLLAIEGVDFKALRDPWGQPYRAQFYFERNLDLLDIYSNGADERAGTDDDFTVARFARPYFRAIGERIDRAADEYHKRTGRYIRDLATLRDELRRAGFDLDALRDRWGQPYRFEFGVSESSYTITARTGGPDKMFAQTVYDADDFALWTTLTDYFVERRASIDAALARHLRETASFPRTEDALRAALKKSGVRLDDLQDAWGRRPYVTFKADKRYADRVKVESRGQYDPNAPRQRTEIKPVTATIHVAEMRSAGADGKAGTIDDFTLAYFTSLAAEQAAQDDAPRHVKPITTFSGGTGAITGAVTDPNGAAVAGATVRAVHQFAELLFETKTDDEGVFLLRNLPSGLYRLEAEALGFLRATISDVQVKSSSLTKADVYLNVGAVTETVTVTGAPASPVEVSSSMVGTKVESRVVIPLQLSTPRLRQFFPETLVWQPALETDRQGRASLRFKLADNITTWKMSVIASTEDGRVGTIEKEFLAFQPFFVEHDPPRILTEGDRISLPVVLRNYLERAQAVEVEMKPESWFALDGPARQRSEVPAGDAARPTFDLRAIASVKDGPQRVTATGADANDAIEKPVTVHPDGEERSLTDATVFADAGALTLNVPSDAIRGSVRSELKIYPNLTAHLLEGVEAIMSRPYGCGEQTISSTYPSVLVLDHYRRKGADLDGDLPPLVARARRYARIGYERLLGYRAPGGGFSYWGRGDADLALTAYALRFLNDASRVTEVDENVINETRDWLVKQQREDGSWPARLYWSNTEDTRRTALNTAFIARVLASLPHDEAKPKAPAPVAATSVDKTPPLRRALRYLAARIEEIDEPYLIASYALAALDAGEQDGAARGVAKLRALAREEGAGAYWSLETNTPFYGWGLAGRVETTALAVNALNKYCGLRIADCGIEKQTGRLGDRETGRQESPDQTSPRPPVPPSPRLGNPQLIDRGLLFLLRNKDRYGVWHSTQATINVLDALLGIVARDDAASARQTNGTPPASTETAEVFVNGRRAGEIALPPAGELSVPLAFDLSPFVAAGESRVEVRRAGRAARAQAQVVTTFYVPWKSGATPQGNGEAKQADGDANRNRSSTLRLAVAYDRPSAAINQEVTCSVEAERIGHSGYGMMLAEIGLPPGADVDRASLERTMKESGWAINSYDVLPDRLVVYLWPAGGGTKFNFKFRPRYGLDALTAPSQVYDYYNPEARAVLAPTRFVIR
ncbi:MAG TPA: MG2 domain-containing protein, partial [Pyrinomonadaceae bacterium]|nr:MG2 domain-containing protein [Pyrinomonadaceae bacterium]